MSDHDVELVTLYALSCDCSVEDQQDEESHPPDAMGEGNYCLKRPIGTACRWCSEEADAWVDHLDIDEDEDEDADPDVTVLMPGVWLI